MYIYVLLTTVGMTQPTISLHATQSGAMEATGKVLEWTTSDEKSFEATSGKTFFQVEKLRVNE